MLDEKYKHIPLKQRQLIRKLNNNGLPTYAKDGTKIMKILRYMFKLNLFREIKECEYNILTTHEWNNKLNDYVELDYDEQFMRKCNETNKQEQLWSEIYYSDFETDPTTSPHTPILNCTIRFDKDNKIKARKFCW